MLDTCLMYRGHSVTLPPTANFGDVYECNGDIFIWMDAWEPIGEISTPELPKKEIKNIVAATCPHCGAPLSVSEHSNIAHCEYCDTNFILS